MGKRIMIWIAVCLTGCSGGALQVDATDYWEVYERAQQEQKSVVVLVTSADCPICHAMLSEWAEDREWEKWRKQHILLCRMEASGPSDFFPVLLNTMAVPLIVVLSPERQIQYLYSGFLPAGRLKEVLTNPRRKDRPLPPRLDNDMYTTSAKDLYGLFSDVLEALLSLRGSPTDRQKGWERLQNSLQTEPYFMNRYLEWKYCMLEGDTVKADSCRKELLNTLDDQDRLLYAFQIAELRPTTDSVEKSKVFPRDYYFEWEGKNKEAEISIPYENIFAKPLIVLSVRQSCNCLITKWDTGPLPPGGKSWIRITYRNKGEGIFRKAIRIYTNDPGSPYEITLHGRRKK